jgi:hypothetical protein
MPGTSRPFGWISHLNGEKSRLTGFCDKPAEMVAIAELAIENNAIVFAEARWEPDRVQRNKRDHIVEHSRRLVGGAVQLARAHPRFLPVLVNVNR